MVKQVSDSTFEAEVLQASTPVLIDFFAEWCGPCKMMGPIVDDVARELEGKLKVVKVDVDQAQATASAFGINAMPTFVVVRDGRETYRRVGAASRSAFLSEVRQAI
jgi:thioredoxin 1